MNASVFIDSSAFWGIVYNNQIVKAMLLSKT